MDPSQVSDPTEKGKVTLQIRGSAPKAGDAHFQNNVSLSNHQECGMAGPRSLTPSPPKMACNGIGINSRSKSHEDFEEIVPRVLEEGDLKLLKETLANIREKQRLENPQLQSRLPKKREAAPATSPPTNSVTGANVSVPIQSYTSTTIPPTGNQSNGVGANGKSGHVEIDVDMTLAEQQESDEKSYTPMPSPEHTITEFRGFSFSASNDLMHNGQSIAERDFVIAMNSIMQQQPRPCSTGSSSGRGQYFPISPAPTQSMSAPLLHMRRPEDEDLASFQSVNTVRLELADKDLCHYRVIGANQQCLFETTEEQVNEQIESKYIKHQHKVLVLNDMNQRGVLKLVFGKSRSLPLCQHMGIATITKSLNPRSEEPLTAIFKDQDTCLFSCFCWPQATYDCVPQQDGIHPFRIKTKGRWKSRDELLIKDGRSTSPDDIDTDVLAFINKVDSNYTLTIPQELNTATRACLVGFLIAMDVMDREDTSGFMYRLWPACRKQMVILICVIILGVTFGVGLMWHNFYTNELYRNSASGVATFDEPGSERTGSVPHINYERSPDSVYIAQIGGTPPLSPSHSHNNRSSNSNVNEFNFDSVTSSSDVVNRTRNSVIGSSSNWAL